MWWHDDGIVSVWTVAPGATGIIDQRVQDRFGGTARRSMNLNRPYATGDFDGNGSFDVAWFWFDIGNTFTWFFQGALMAGASDAGPLATPYPPPQGGWFPGIPDVIGAGDLDGDGHDELVTLHPQNRYLGTAFYSPVGDEPFPYPNGLNVLNAPAILLLVGATPIGVADVNADGRDDVVYVDRTGEAFAYLMAGTRSNGTLDLGPMPSGASPVGLVDVTNDRRADVVWRTPDGRVSITVTGTKPTTATALDELVPAASWDFGLAGDIDGDGHRDLAWRNKTSGDLRVWFLDGARRVRSAPLGPTGSTPPSWKLIPLPWK